MQGLAAVEATAEGDEYGGVGRPHGRPGWAGPAKRVLYFYQAPGPDPAHYHQDNCRPTWPAVGRVVWGRGRRRGGAGREGEGREFVGQPHRERRGRGGEKRRRRRHREGEEEGEEASWREREMVRQRRERSVRGGMSSTLQGGRGRVRRRLQSRGGRGTWEPMESEMENSYTFCILENFSFYIFLEFLSFN